MRFSTSPTGTIAPFASDNLCLSHSRRFVHFLVATGRRSHNFQLKQLYALITKLHAEIMRWGQTSHNNRSFHENGQRPKRNTIITIITFLCNKRVNEKPIKIHWRGQCTKRRCEVKICVTSSRWHFAFYESERKKRRCFWSNAINYISNVIGNYRKLISLRQFLIFNFESPRGPRSLVVVITHHSPVIRLISRFVQLSPCTGR